MTRTNGCFSAKSTTPNYQPEQMQLDETYPILHRSAEHYSHGVSLWRRMRKR